MNPYNVLPMLGELGLIPKEKPAHIERELDSLYDERIEDKVSDYQKDNHEVLAAIEAVAEEYELAILFSDPVKFQELVLKDLRKTAELHTDYPNEDDL